ncbi:MAG TPA: P1 family peptidase [Solirubrobacteraceae bacterium]|jgi:L-aminopeptidase/D-esterase-like protein|nr:P1 family peptidase [Solirubrobacteraceae bacterium]
MLAINHRTLPEGFRVGHDTDPHGLTGCTVIVLDEDAGASAAGEVRGAAPGTREFDLLSPASTTAGVQALLFTGGSAFGLRAAEGVVATLLEAGRGHPTPVGPVPLVPAVVVFDLPLGSAQARPDADAGARALRAAGRTVARGSVGAGTGCTVGKLLGPRGWTRGGLGYAAARAGAITVGALAVVNALGEVLGEHGEVLAGVFSRGRYRRSVELLAGGSALTPGAREATTLVAVVTDASLTKVQAWAVARAASAGLAQAVTPTATAFDGDVAVCLASGRREPGEPFVIGALAGHLVAAAIRDGVRQATSAPGCPSAADRA